MLHLKKKKKKRSKTCPQKNNSEQKIVKMGLLTKYL